MPRYYFDLFDGRSLRRDMIGGEFASRSAMRLEAMRTLPEIAKDEIPKDGDRQTFTVRVRNENDLTVYIATILFSGVWMDDGDGAARDLDDPFA